MTQTQTVHRPGRNCGLCERCPAQGARPGRSPSHGDVASGRVVAGSRPYTGRRRRRGCGDEGHGQGAAEWAAIENLLVAAEARVIESNGSRVRFEKDREVETFHRPQPAKEAKRYQVRAARAFLERIGITP